MKDYSACPIDRNVLFSGAERKYEIRINGYRYIMKYQKNSEIGLLYNHVSEYLGSHVFESVGIPVQETFLGTYEGKNIVLMKNFCREGEVLVHFNDVGESTLEQDRELYQYCYEDVQQMLLENCRLTDVTEGIQRFWDMYIVDALNGNFDRHGGNWGFLKMDGKYRLAPVYDNGSSMYPRLNSDEALEKILSSEEEINRRIYDFPTSQIKLHGKKSSYHEVISSLAYPECNAALLRIVPRINPGKIIGYIDGIEGISNIRKEFYRTMYRQRFRKILKPAYERLVEMKGDTGC